jgi:molybdopterin-binding protein
MVVIMTQLRIRDAADILGVSDDTVRRMVDVGILTARNNGGGPMTVDGYELAMYQRAQHQRTRAQRVAGDGVSEASGVSSSARNRFVGLVTAITSDPVMSQVELQCGPFRVVSLMSTEAVGDLGLELGSVAVAVIKSTNVVVETRGARALGAGR